MRNDDCSCTAPDFSVPFCSSAASDCVDCLQFLLSYTSFFRKAIGIFDKFRTIELVIINKISLFGVNFAIPLVFLLFMMYIVYNLGNESLSPCEKSHGKCKAQAENVCLYSWQSVHCFGRYFPVKSADGLLPGCLKKQASDAPLTFEKGKT